VVLAGAGAGAGRKSLPQQACRGEIFITS